MTRPASWFSQNWPDAAAAQRDRCDPRMPGRWRCWPSDKHGDWLLWRLPELRGRVAYDVRFELVTRGAARLDRALQVAAAGVGSADTRVQRGRRRPGGHPKARRRVEALGARRLYRDEDIVVFALPGTR